MVLFKSWKNTFLRKRSVKGRERRKGIVIYFLQYCYIIYLVWVMENLPTHSYSTHWWVWEAKKEPKADKFGNSANHTMALNQVLQIVKKKKDQNRKHWFPHYCGKISCTAKEITFWAFSILSVLHIFIYDTFYIHIRFYVPVYYIICLYDMQILCPSINTVYIILFKTEFFFLHLYFISSFSKDRILCFYLVHLFSAYSCFHFKI